MSEVLRLENISMSFPSPGGQGELEILKNISLSVEKGASVSVMGRSGSGKSTLLYVSSLIERPTGGNVYCSGRKATDLSERQLAALRRDMMGFVFQNSLLMEDFTALENVMLPLMNRGEGRKKASLAAMQALESMGLADRAGHRPFELSGGERQRTAIARAMVTRPEIIFADEPTGALDESSQRVVEDIFAALADEGIALLLVTHDPDFALRMKQRYILEHKELRQC